MASAARDLEQLLSAIAESRGYAFPERLPAWKKRLASNAEQVRAFLAAPGRAEASLLTMPESHPATVRSDRFDYTAHEQGTRGVVDIARRVNSGEVSAVDIAAEHLDRAESRRDLNAFITLDRNRVLTEAEAVAAAVKRGSKLPLAGVPIAIKDAIAVKGYPMTCGTKVIDAPISEADAECVSRLRAAGAVIIGTTNLDELGYAATGLHAPFGRIINPKAPDRIAGGSSGGSAVAVAANLAAAALGTDTGGALRLPASCCGIVGLKPTHGAISSKGYAIRAPSLDSVGPMTRSVADCALVFEVLAGRPIGSMLGNSPGSTRIRVVKPTNYFFENVEEDDVAAVERAIGLFRSAGMSVADARLRDVEHSPAAHFITVAAEATEMFWDLLVRTGRHLGEDLRARLEVGQFILAADYIKAQRFRRHLREMFLEALADGDVLVTPTVQVLPPKVDESSVSVAAHASSLLGRFTGPLNVAGLPGITIPCGVTSDGAPVGLQIIGRPDDEASVFRVAHFWESILATVLVAS